MSSKNDPQDPKLTVEPRKPAHAQTTVSEVDDEQSGNAWVGKAVSFLFFAAVGAGVMYAAMPHIMKSEKEVAQTGGAAAGKNAGVTVPVEAVEVEEIDMADTLVVTATLEANESATLKPEVSGRIVSIPFKEGTDVKKGDVLFKLDDSVQKAALAQAQANVSFAENNASRYNKLMDSRAISRTEAEQANADVKSSRANVALAQANLSKMTIKAPFDGIVGIRNVSVGDVIDQSVDLVTVTQTKPLRVIFELPERYLTNVAVEQPVRFTVTSKPNQIFEAVVTAIDSQVSPTTRAVKVKASIPNEDGALLSGQFASLAFGLSSDAKVMAVPDSAIVPEGGQFFVYQIDADNKAQKVNVQPGLRDGTNVEIKRGLKVGDRVVTAGQQKLFPGMSVKALPASKVTVLPFPEEESSR